MSIRSHAGGVGVLPLMSLSAILTIVSDLALELTNLCLNVGIN